MLESEIPTIECTNVTDRRNTYSRIRGSRVRLKLKCLHGLLFFRAVIHRTLASVPQPMYTCRIYTLLCSEISHKSHSELNANADSDDPLSSQ